MIELFLKELSLKGWKQQSLADIMGVERSFVSRLANGASCSVDIILKLADAFGVSTDVVLGRDKGRVLNPVEDLLLKVTDGDERIARVALRSAQGEKSLLIEEGESGKGNVKKSA